MKNRTTRSRGRRGFSRTAGYRWRRLTSRIRLLPDFIIIGVQRSGTTSLYNYLTGNPYVFPAHKKEVHFFDLNFAKGLGWYRAHFPLFLRRLYVEYARGHDLITGEATPAYLFHPLVPERVARTLPRVKLIGVLRNPVDRAYSHYWRKARARRETLSFEEAIGGEPEALWYQWKRALEGETQSGSDLRHSSLLIRRHAYLSRGIYVDQLQAWGRLFSREQMLILCSEDFYADPGMALKKVCAFLNVPNWEAKEYPIYRRGQYPEMGISTRERLIDYYRSHNERLYEYLGVKFDWDK